MPNDRQPAPPQAETAWPLGLRVAHWTAALAALAAAGLAIYLLNPPEWSPAYVQRYRDWAGVHKALGLTALIAVLALTMGPRRRPARTGSEAQRNLARAGQAALLGLVIVAALSGYLSDALFGNGVALPGLPEIPPPFAKNTAVAEIFHSLHAPTVYAFLIVAAGHVGFALYHQLFGRDAVISRMLGLDGGQKGTQGEDQ